MEFVKKSLAGDAWQALIFILYCLVGKRKKYEEISLALCPPANSEIWNTAYEAYYAATGWLIEDLEKTTSSAFKSVLAVSQKMTKPKILEVGLGRAIDLILIKKKLEDGEVYGADFSDGIINGAKGVSATLNCSLNLIKCKLSETNYLPFRDETFDIVFHQGLLEFFPNPSGIWREQLRILKKGGYLIVSVPQLYHTYTILKQTLIRRGRFGLGWETEYSAKELQRILFNLNGVEIEEIVGRGSLFDNWTWSYIVRLTPGLSRFLEKHLSKFFAVSIVATCQKVW